MTLARSSFTLIWAFGAVLAIGGSAAGHRLDEYLQATRIIVSARQIVLELELTPGVEVAPRIAAAIDSNGDGTLSTAERLAYAQRVADDVLLEIDGLRQSLSINRSEFSPLAAMREGVGSIRLELTATLPAALSGKHVLGYHNGHRTDVGVFLVNALQPSTDEILITDQERDFRQQGIRLGFEVRSSRRARELWLWLGVVAGLGLSLAARARIASRRSLQ